MPRKRKKKVGKSRKECFSSPAPFLRYNEWGDLECPCKDIKECKKEEIRRLKHDREEYERRAYGRPVKEA